MVGCYLNSAAIIAFYATQTYAPCDAVETDSLWIQFGSWNINISLGRYVN
jgi:hypothetical protein